MVARTKKARHIGGLVSVVLVIAAIGLAAAAPIAPTDKLPKPIRGAIQKAIQKAFPGAHIEEIGYDRRIATLLDVTVLVDGEPRDITISPDGLILEIGQATEVGSTPPAVRTSLAKLISKGAIEEVERRQIVAELKPVPLKKPRIVYEFDYRAGGQLRELVLDEQGKRQSTGIVR